MDTLHKYYNILFKRNKILYARTGNFPIKMSLNVTAQICPDFI